MRILVLLASLAGVVVVAFACTTSESPPQPRLIIKTATSGLAADLDPDGYDLSGLPGGVTALGINTADTLVVPEGSYTLALGGIAANCVAAQNPQVVALAPGETGQVNWQVTCGVIPGTLQVIFDAAPPVGPGLMLLSIDGGPQRQIGPGDTLAVDSLSPASHEVVVTVGTPNCRIPGSPPRSALVTRGQTTVLSLTGYCSPGTIVFDEYIQPDWTVYRMNADTSGLAGVPDPRAGERLYPALSLDGTAIAYITGYDSLNLMLADGSASHGVAQVINIKEPAWSPDGLRLAFSASPGVPYEIYVVDRDGQHLVNLTNDPSSDENPSWSPDGSTIAFTSGRSGSGEIYVMDTAGAGLTRLTQTGGFNPSWSPDGTRIAYVGEIYRVWMMNRDGSNPHPAGSASLGYIGRIAWSPDGRFLLYPEDGVGLVFQPLDGSGTITVSRSGDFTSVNWGP